MNDRADGGRLAEHRELSEWDGAYVLGALTPAERRRYERHLEQCERCRRAVTELAALPGLLARAGGPASAPPSLSVAGPPAGMLERTVRRASRSRRRGRLAFAALAAAAATALLGGIVLGVSGDVAEQAEPVVLQPLEGPAVTARVGLRTVAWGTRLTLECAHPEQAPAAGPYTLVVIGRGGEASRLSSWNPVPGRTVVVDAGTSLPAEEIVAIEIRGADGELLLRGTR